MDKCCLCKEDLANGPAVILRQKGVDGIKRISNREVQIEVGQSVHVKCRRDFCRDTCRLKNQNTPENEVSQTTIVRRSKKRQFCSKEHCLFCGQQAKYDRKKKGLDLIPMRTKDFQESIAKLCHERHDDWAKIVLGRLEYARDLHAADTLYHQQCSVNFRTGKQIPKQFECDNDLCDVSNNSPGRPTNSVKTSAFEKVVDFLEENDNGQITINDLCLKMKSFLEGSNDEPYTAQYMKFKLQEHFGDRVVITTVKKKANVVTFCTTAESIINDFYCTPQKDDCEEEKVKIITTAAKLIKHEINSLDGVTDEYPSSEEMSSVEEALKYVPNLLKQFLQVLLIVNKNSELKLVSLAQAIIQGTRPKTIISPLQLGLAVQMHHHFASRFLIDTLHSHGFCASYSTVQNFERSAAASQATDIPGHTPDMFIQYIADNVDHNTRTLDGKGTFHGMGIIAALTPKCQIRRIVPKITVSNEEVKAVGRITVHHYQCQTQHTMPLLYKQLTNPKIQDPYSDLDFLLKVTQPLVNAPKPAWSGTMQMLCKGSHPGQSSLLFLPMIDLDPNDLTCIYSTLVFITEQANQYNVTPIITFDQPLWWNATMIILNEPKESKLKSIVLRLGSFHAEMSFLGCIGHVMAGSGIQDVLELVYAKNAVVHMLSGKALARAVRGHFLIDAALNSLLVCSAFKLSLSCDETELDGEQSNDCVLTDKEPPMNIDSEHGENAEDLDKAVSIFQQLNQGTLTVDNIPSDVIKRLCNTLEVYKASMRSHRTSVLWMQYMQMVDILRRLITAERTGNWRLHIQALHDMLPYFAATGHNHYTKSVHVYLQVMAELNKTHPEVHKHFLSGLHVVRRSDRFWAGLSTDLAIEQVLMRSIKTTGGLTRGRGLTEMQRLIWLMSMPSCAEINESMQALTDVRYQTSEQHKDASKSRQDRDYSDTKEIISYLKLRNPFNDDPTLRNIETGVVGDTCVNVDNARDIGKKISLSMVGKDAHNFSFQRKNQVITLASKSSISVKEGHINIDPQLLFQRLSIIATGGDFENPCDLFKFEMCSYPPALFDPSLFPRQANKPVIADTLWELTKDKQTTKPPSDVKYVLDGGALIHRIPWHKTTYEAILNMYVQYVNRKYRGATVVFDGYSQGPSTKDCTHLRRTPHYGPMINFETCMTVTQKREDFLSNATNKQRFIILLGDRLQENGCEVIHSTGDADRDIVLTAVKHSRSKSTILVGDDTDLLVLLLFHAEMGANDIFLQQEPKQRSSAVKIWSIKDSKLAVGPIVYQNILFCHAFLGCDTTSRVYGFGKGLAVKKILKDSTFQKHAEIFRNQSSSKESIINAGEKALVCLYKGKEDESLNSIRYTLFCKKVASTASFLHPEVLPPTSAAAAYHSQRVYYQVQDWIGNNRLNPQQWGWKLEQEKLLPTLTDIPAAHQSLLEMIRCNCKSDCSSQRCTCRKHGLGCSAACGFCKGNSCTNSPPIDIDAMNTN